MLELRWSFRDSTLSSVVDSRSFTRCNAIVTKATIYKSSDLCSLSLPGLRPDWGNSASCSRVKPYRSLLSVDLAFTEAYKGERSMRKEAHENRIEFRFEADYSPFNTLIQWENLVALSRRYRPIKAYISHYTSCSVILNACDSVWRNELEVGEETFAD